jgi:hypothetical protein
MELSRQQWEELFQAVHGEVLSEMDDPEWDLESFQGNVALTRDPMTSYAERYHVEAERLYSDWQPRKGFTRGDLFIRDYGDFRAVYFTGEGLN